jgi:uncharacterized protein (TIGR00251 family)
MPSTTVRVRVIPGSATSEIVATLADGTLKIRIAAPPERGKANAALIPFLAAHYKVAPSAVTIVSGNTSRLKLVKIRR